MDDILSQGGDREPSPWPRRLAVLGAVFLAAVGGVIYVSHSRQPHSPVAAVPTPLTSSLVPAPVGLAVPGLANEPDGIGGHTLPWADSLRLPVTGTQPAWFSPATGRSVPIGGLPAGSSGYQFTRVSGGWAVQAGPAARVERGDDQDPACSDCVGPPPVWFLADGASSVTRVGTANQVAPAATAGALWLTSYPVNAAVSTAAGTAREVSLSGVPLGAPVRLPAGYVISQATDRGLLLAPVSPQPGTTADKLWDSAAPTASRTFDGVIAATATEIAWAANCARQCRIQLLNLSTGRQATVRLPAGTSAGSGAFSPSGDFLALQVNATGMVGDDGALGTRLEVASVTSGHLTAVPGTFVSSDALIGFGWPAGSDSLVAEFAFTTKEQLASWHPGATRPAVAVIPPGPEQASFIVG
ncbi:MAG TPA: hypothetical protein VHZ03_57980 [Trebonia sp.]|nr:hypothetical protein [Trebonia sp.]